MAEELKKSRTQIKREMLTLQKIGEHLVDLSAEQIQRMDLPSALKDAVLDAQSIKKHGARRRQLQYIGSLMRKVDPVPIRKALENMDQRQTHSILIFKQTEQWRDRLLAGDDTLIEELSNRFIDIDRQQLWQLVRNARKEKDSGHQTKASRSLFRYLKPFSEKQSAPFENTLPSAALSE